MQTCSMWDGGWIAHTLNGTTIRRTSSGAVWQEVNFHAPATHRTCCSCLFVRPPLEDLEQYIPATYSYGPCSTGWW